MSSWWPASASRLASVCSVLPARHHRSKGGSSSGRVKLAICALLPRPRRRLSLAVRLYRVALRECARACVRRHRPGHHSNDILDRLIILMIKQLKWPTLMHSPLHSAPIKSSGHIRCETRNLISDILHVRSLGTSVNTAPHWSLTSKRGCGCEQITVGK
jgi:hypothetical protein